jgi:hypothetical protein
MFCGACLQEDYIAELQDKLKRLKGKLLKEKVYSLILIIM